jgi:predicted enzyme related to lactoylglutathione lyase
MAHARPTTRRIGRAAKAQLPLRQQPVALIPILIPDPPPAQVRGVPLKHVASFTTCVALLCLLAFIAGRVDASAADVTNASAGVSTGVADTMQPIQVNAASLAPLDSGTFDDGQMPINPVDAKESHMFLGLRTVKYDVPDIAKAKAWYTKVFGVEPYFDQPEFYVGYNIGGYELGLTPEPKAGAKREAAGVAYWGVDDAHAAYKRLIELGATAVSEVQDVGGGILVGEVRDPFGNVIGVIYNPHFKPDEAK